MDWLQSSEINFPLENELFAAWYLSHFHDGPTELVVVREKGGQAP